MKEKIKKLFRMKDSFKLKKNMLNKQEKKESQGVDKEIHSPFGHVEEEYLPTEEYLYKINSKIDILINLIKSLHWLIIFIVFLAWLFLR